MRRQGAKYTSKVEVYKTPSGKYKAQGHVQITYPGGRYEIVGAQSLTFDKRKDAEAFAKQERKNLVKIKRMYMDAERGRL